MIPTHQGLLTASAPQTLSDEFGPGSNWIGHSHQWHTNSKILVLLGFDLTDADAPKDPTIRDTLDVTVGIGESNDGLSVLTPRLDSPEVMRAVAANESVFCDITQLPQRLLEDL